METGKLLFAEIRRLPDNWWLGRPADDPADVWTVWDKNTYYLWGANSGNYQGIPIGKSLGGDGMAGMKGPTRGRAHPHYIGINTMGKNDLPLNDPVFTKLDNHLKNGRNIVIPIFDGKFSLGTGISSKVLGSEEWSIVQKSILEKIYDLSQNAASVETPISTYWPDCRHPEPFPEYPITKPVDLMDIVNNVLNS